MKALEAAKLMYRSASDELAYARRQRNNFTSNYERDCRAADVRQAEHRVCVTLDKLWTAQRVTATLKVTR